MLSKALSVKESGQYSVRFIAVQPRNKLQEEFQATLLTADKLNFLTFLLYMGVGVGERNGTFREILLATPIIHYLLLSMETDV